MAVSPTVRINVSGARGESQADILRRTGRYGVLPGDTDDQAMGKLNAAAELAAATAESAAGPTYPNTAAGLAATTDGQAFAVDNGDGTVTIYLNSSGSAVAQRTLATTAALAANGGSLIGLGQGGTVQDAVSWVTPQMFGAVTGTVSTTQARANRAAFNAAIAFLHAAGGGVVRVPRGIYHIAAEASPSEYSDSYIHLRGGVHIEGDGMDSTRIVRASTYSMLANSPSTDDSYTSNGTDFRVARLTLDGNPSGQNTPANIAYFSNATGIVFEDVRFLNCPGLHSLDLNGVKDVSVIRCRFEGHDHALTTAYGGSSYVPEAIQAGFIVSTDHSPVPCVSIFLRECYFGPSDALTPPKVSIGNHTAFLGAICENIAVEGCTMEGMTSFGARPFCWNGAIFRNNTFVGCTHGIYVTSALNTYDANSVTTGIPQSNSDILIDGNRFINIVGGPPIGLSNAGGSNVTSYAKAKRVTITNNIIRDSAAQTAHALLLLTWADGLTVSGNKHTGTRARAVQMRFCSNVSIADNDFDTYSVDAFTINESGTTPENTWVGTGVSDRIAITGNIVKAATFYGMNLAGALTKLTVNGNKISGVGTPSARSGILVQSNVSGAVIQGNILDGSNGGMTYGVDIRPGCANIIVGDNQISGALTAPYIHAGGGRLTSGGSGTPASAITAPLGSTWTRTDGGGGSTFYVKESGAGAATGWAAK